MLLPAALDIPMPNDSRLGDVITELLTVLQKIARVNASGKTDIELAPWVALELFPRAPQNSVFCQGGPQVSSYQFFLATEKDKPLLNIATWIPSMDRRDARALMLQQEGGRPYAIEIAKKVDITQQLCSDLQKRFSRSTLLQNDTCEDDGAPVFVDPGRDAQIDTIRGMIEADGVLSTMRVLFVSTPDPAEDNFLEQPHG